MYVRMFNELRTGINTRLESKNEFNNYRDQFLNNRNEVEHSIIKPRKQADLVSFNEFNKKYNEKYEKLSQEYEKTLLSADKQLSENIHLEKNILNAQIITHINSPPHINNSLEKVNIPTKSTVIPSQPPINTQRFNPPLKKNTSLNNKVNKQSLQFPIKKKYFRPSIFIKRKESYSKLLTVIDKILRKRGNHVKSENILSYLKRYNLNDSNYSPNILKQIIKELIQYSNPKSNLTTVIQQLPKTSVISLPKYKESTFLITISSNDRDINNWPNLHEYQIDLNKLMSNSKNNSNNNLNNVKSIQLVSAIFPKKSPNGDNLENYPYIILEIDEFGKTYEGTKNISKAFAQLTFDIDLGKFKKLVPRRKDEYLKIFNPQKTFNFLTFRFKTPAGRLYNFNNTQNIDFIENTKLVEESVVTENRDIDNTNTEIETEPNDLLTKVGSLTYDPDNLDLFQSLQNSKDKSLKTDSPENVDLVSKSFSNPNIKSTELLPEITLNFKITSLIEKKDTNFNYT